MEFNKLVVTLSLIRGYLLDTEKVQVSGKALKFWLNQLQDLAYETEDLLDDFNTEAFRRRSVAGGRKKMVNEVSIFFSSSNQFIYANRMAHRIKDLKEKLDFLGNLAGLFNLQSLSMSPSMVEPRHRRPLTVSYDYESYVVGRDEDNKYVMDFLFDPNFELNLSIHSIVGFGGMGKTALTRLVFKDERLKKYFHQKIWVCVSTNFVVEDILRKLVEECSPETKKDEIARMEMNGLHEKLKEKLGEKRLLLVLDDVWNENMFEWLRLLDNLPYGVKGSKILVTTHSLDVANTIDERQLKLSVLDEDESLILLMLMAGKEKDELKSQHLEDTAKKFVKKCCGVPLAIKTIGRLLSTCEDIEWSDLLKKDFSKIKQKEGDIMPTLKISYDFLPSHLKQCFAYCCLFPKGYELHPNELVRLWMAQGFILKSSTTSRKTLHDVGKEYFMELASRSFFQDFERDRHGNITRCKMHHLMHDLATMVAGDSCTTIVNNGSGASHENIPKEVRLVSMGVDRGSYKLKSLGPNQGIIRSLLFINQYLDINSFSGDISSFRNLRALRLHRLAKGDVLRCIGKLKHLRSLDLSWSTKLTSLPNSIGKLFNLDTLILYGCGNLISLPRGITKLVNLRHLNVEGRSSFTNMPRGIGNLTNLEVLRGFRVEERQEWNAARMNELVKLSGLEELSIEYLGRVKKELDSVADFWIDKSRLQRLHLSWGTRGADNPSEYLQAEEVLKRLEPNLDLLKSLTIEECPGTKLSSWTSRLHNLVEIKLYRCDHIRSIPPLYQLSSLESIRLSDCNNMRMIPPLDQLSSLESIKLSHCKNMRSIPPLDQLSSLESIKLSHCKNMRSIPPLDQLPSLKSIKLRSLRELGWIEVTENSICLYPSLEEIDLEELPIFKGWKRKRMDISRSGDQTIHSSSSSSSSSSSLFFIPFFSRKVHVKVSYCEMLCCMWNDNEKVSLQLKRMKYKDLEELSKSRRNVEEEEEEDVAVTQMGSLSLCPYHLFLSIR